MKKIKKKLTLKKISIAKIGNTNKIVGGAITNSCITGCNFSFEIDTKPDYSVYHCNDNNNNSIDIDCPLTWDCANTIDTCDQNGIPI